MAMIHLARDGAKLGSFSAEEVQEGLRTGKFLPTDLAWQEGMPDWRPLGEVMGAAPAGGLGPAGTPAQPVAISTPVGGATDSGAGLPWERRQELGLMKAFFETVKMVLTQPAVAFTAMKSEGDLAGPMLFALIGGSAGVIVSLLFQMALGSIGNRNETFGLGLIGGCGYIIVAPILVILGVFIWSGILHLCLSILGGARKPFETTFRVVCFSSGSTQLIAMIPLCGGFIAGVWNLIVECIGLARAHDIDTGKAVLAVFLPAIVCCGGIILVITLGGGLGALSQLLRN